MSRGAGLERDDNREGAKQKGKVKEERRELLSRDLHS